MSGHSENLFFHAPFFVSIRLHRLILFSSGTKIKAVPFSSAPLPFFPAKLTDSALPLPVMLTCEAGVFPVTGF